ncbi:NAD-dependent epimerase/dehydratase family protein [Longispora urticae]
MTPLRVAVIGGSRYFGRLLVDRLRTSGAQVTLVNRGSTPPPPGVDHVRADRDDEQALRAALADRTFDVVLDQVCSTPTQAAVARRVLTGRTARYVMTSTIEVYAQPTAPEAAPGSPHTTRPPALREPGNATSLETGVPVPLPEAAFDPTTWPVDFTLPWRDPTFRDAHYAEGKRQAEAVFATDPPFPFVAVRSAHVLGGADFTGRLAHYVDRARTGTPILIHRDPRPSSFTHPDEIADFLHFTALADFTGPVNARSHGELTVTDLCAHLTPAPVYREVSPGEEASPYSFAHYYGMSNARAESLGYHFSHTADWLPTILKET